MGTGIGVNIEGLSERIEAMAGLARGLKSAVRKTLGTYGGKMTEHARQNHEFTSRTGNADRSIDIDLPKGEMKMVFGVVKDIAQSHWRRNKNVSYVTFLHEGTYHGYRKSPAAAQYTPTEPKRKGAGILADWFIYEAWEHYLE
jgi:hypothetical protein